MTDLERGTTDDAITVELARIHEVTGLDRAVAHRIHRTNRLLLTHLGRVLADHHDGMTPELWFVLARIDENTPVRAVDLTEPALVDAPNVSRLVEKLVRAGLVDRSRDPDDRRSQLLAPTRLGTELAAAIRRRTVEERYRVFDGFDAEQLDALTSTLDRLDDNVRRLLSDSTAATANPIGDRSAR